MEFLKVKDGKICKGQQSVLLRGMGLGGWLLPEGYMWKFYTKCDRPRRIEALIESLCGKAYADDFWNRYYADFITEADIAWIAGQGLNSVRLPLNARHLFNVSEEGRVSFCEECLKNIDNCLQWCEKYGVYLFLDMHGAPGGQTGQNIDDSENDKPELFIKEHNQDMLVTMWQLLARRYVGEAAIGGYDLLNEPLPDWNNQYNDRLLPLYRRLIKAIRQIDSAHIIILEGAHWSTDFSVFDDFTLKEAADNIVLQFHKYWSDPDEESIIPFTETARRLGVPLWMGEGGENNLEWYTYVFPMYERLGIGWCFWTYKKMNAPNSPVSFAKPLEWEKILAHLDGAEPPAPDMARKIFEDFLMCIKNGNYHPEVIQALLRRPPVRIPAAAYDAERIISRRQEGVSLRRTSGATLLFADGHRGKADWRRYGGESQPSDQEILLRLEAGDAVGYRVETVFGYSLTAFVEFQGTGVLKMQNIIAENQKACLIELSEDGLIWIWCESGEVSLKSLLVTM